jgi:putative flippase GtrA
LEAELISKFLKFCVVGFSGLGIDFGITYLFKEQIRINRYIANSLGFTAAVVSNYFLNRIWTFADTNPAILEQFTKFMLISVGGLLLSNLIIYLLEKRKINFYIAKFIAIAVVVLWNFFMNYKYSFG